ncbi:MAG: hypothetical protein WDN26_22180 [Chitinophagaceae bacterium]
MTASSSAVGTTRSFSPPISAKRAENPRHRAKGRCRRRPCDARRPAPSRLLHNTHAFFQRAITAMPWYADLELERHGLRYIEPELNVALIASDGRALEWWTDIERTIASFESFSRKDAATLRRWQSDFVPIVQNILSPESRSPPLPASERRALLEKSAAGRYLLDVSALSPLEFVHREFENPTVQAGLLFFNGLREVDLRVRGFGHHIAALLASPAKAQMSRGGTAALARALEASVRESGGEIRLLTEPRKILIEKGKAVGVESTDGEIFRARQFVVSSLNPQQTFLDLLDESLVPREIPRPCRGIRIQPAGAAVRAEPQSARPTALRRDGQASRTGEGFHGHSRSRPRRPVPGDRAPSRSRHDSADGDVGRISDDFRSHTGAADGHTAFMWEKLPYRLHGDPNNWDSAAAKHGATMLDLWSKHAPNLRDDVIDSFTRTALDTERSLPNMREGDLLVGSFTNGQIGHDRPFPGAGTYRAHLPGLYPVRIEQPSGGNVTGLPGYNAAQVILADLGIAAAWAPPADRGKACEVGGVMHVIANRV